MVASPPVTAFTPENVPSLAGLRLAIVGADGFIGNHVCRLAIAAGARVEAVLLQDGWRIADITHPMLVRVAANRSRLGYADALPELGATDVIVWLAYVPPAPGADELEHERSVNARAAVLARRLGPPVVFASSADVYGPTVDGAAHEDLEPSPARPYAVAKLEAEAELADYGPILRLATVFGPGENGPRAIPSFIRALSGGNVAVIHGDGTAVRDYVHVSDVATALLMAAAAPTPTVVNVGSGQGRTTREILAVVAATLGTEARAQNVPAAGPPSRLVLDVARLRSQGLVPSTELPSRIG